MSRGSICPAAAVVFAVLAMAAPAPANVTLSRVTANSPPAGVYCTFTTGVLTDFSLVPELYFDDAGCYTPISGCADDRNSTESPYYQRDAFCRAAIAGIDAQCRASSFNPPPSGYNSQSCTLQTGNLGVSCSDDYAYSGYFGSENVQMRQCAATAGAGPITLALACGDYDFNFRWNHADGWSCTAGALAVACDNKASYFLPGSRQGECSLTTPAAGGGTETRTYCARPMYVQELAPIPGSIAIPTTLYPKPPEGCSY